jgi:uncharacterized membrane protein
VSRVQLAAIALSVAGIAISLYLTGLHYAGATPACPVSGSINCEAVLSSSYALILGSSIPTSVLGVIWFAVSALVWTRQTGWLQVGWSAVGLAGVLGLVYIEIVVLNAICIWCTAAHVLVVALLLIAVTARQSS